MKNRPKRRRRGQGGLRSWFEHVRDFLTAHVWSIELTRLPTFRAIAYKFVRVAFLASRGFKKDNCLNRASALTYVTVLSIVPLLAFSFAVAKGLGAYDGLRQQTIEPFLDRNIGTGEIVKIQESPRADETQAAGDPAADPAEGDLGSPDEDQPLVAGESDTPDDAAELAAGETDPAEAAAAEEAVAGSPQVRQAIDRMLEFVENTNFSGLGISGLAVLLLTIIKLLSSIERSLNEIWGVARSRSMARKFSDYLSIVVVVPLMVGVAGSAAAGADNNELIVSLQEHWGLGLSLETYIKMASLVVIWLGFAVVYVVMPNGRTRILSALIGGMVGGTLWQVIQVLHVRFQIGMADFNALYSSFAAFPVFMVWIYFSWVSVLLGAEVAFAHQSEPAYRQIARTRHHDQGFKEVLSMRIMSRIALAFMDGHEAPTSWQLAEDMGVPERSIEELVRKLHDQRLLGFAEDLPEPGLVPGRDLDQIRLHEIFNALKGKTGPVDFPPRDGIDRRLEGLYATYEENRAAAAKNPTLRELALIAREAREEAPGRGPVALEDGDDESEERSTHEA